MLDKIVAALILTYILSFKVYAEILKDEALKYGEEKSTIIPTNVKETTSIEMNQQNQNDSRVNGGQTVFNIVPYQVSMQKKYHGQWRHFCSGSIISPSHVITAAHCVHKIKNLNEMSILAGTTSWKEGGDRHTLLAKHVHPSFSMDPQIINDIAIVKVTPQFNFHRRTVATINFGGSSRLGKGVAVRLTGWGSTIPTFSHQQSLPERLQMLDYYTITNEACGRKGFKVTWHELCALAPKGKGACVGDSGGPLVTLNGIPQLVGIVSYGTATCAQGRPDVYTRVSSFIPYINKVITKDLP